MTSWLERMIALQWISSGYYLYASKVTICIWNVINYSRCLHLRANIDLTNDEENSKFLSTILKFQAYFTNYETNTRYVCTFPKLICHCASIPNMVMKFNDFDIIYTICYMFDLSSAFACRVKSINIYCLIAWWSQILSRH